MGELGIKTRKKKWLSVLFSFLLPGMGHVYIGAYSKGFLLAAGLLLNYTAIFRLADSDGGRHLLLIVYLLLLLPVFYFLSVFDVLQEEERTEREPFVPKLAHGIWLTLAGAVMLVLIRPPAFMLPWMNELAEWSVGPLLMLAAVWLVMPSWRGGGRAVFKLGRMTAGVFIFASGALLIWDIFRGRNDIALLSEWWPAVFVLLGAELILYSTVLRSKSAKLRLDTMGIAVALVITISAYAVTQYADFPVRWLDQFNADFNGRKDYGEEKGFRFDKNIVKAPFDETVQSLRIVNINGDITVRSGDVQELEVRAVVWVDHADEKEASAVAEQSLVKVTPGQQSLIEGSGQSFGPNGSRLPRLNLEIVVPKIKPLEPETTLPPNLPVQVPIFQTNPPLADHDDSAPQDDTELQADPTPENDSSSRNAHTADEGVAPSPALERGEADLAQRVFNLVIESENGSVSVSDLNATGGLIVKSGSGLVKLSQIVGAVTVEGKDGSVDAEGIFGDSSLVTKNGSISAKFMSGGSLYASTLNGDLELSNVSGDLDAETKNGKIAISEAASAVKADTLNGNIEVSGGTVGGNWDLDSSVGEIEVKVPSDGHFTVYGSVTFGNISTNLPLEQSRKTIRGTIGQGDFRIHINATNSISIQGE